MDQGSELKQMMKTVVSTPNERSQKLLVLANSTHNSNEQSYVTIISSDDEVEMDYKKMKIDLSCVSFLKPHIINDKIYKLAHQGFTKD